MEQKRCAKCGEPYDADFDACPKCAQQPVVVTAQPEKKVNPYAIISLVLGIVSFFVFFEWGIILAIVLGIVGITRAGKHYNGGGLWQAIVGLVLGCVALLSILLDLGFV